MINKHNGIISLINTDRLVLQMEMPCVDHEAENEFLKF